MRRFYIVIAVFALVLLCGCSVPSKNQPVSGEIVYVSPDFWPEDRIVSDLPRPDGETYWVLDESHIGRYSMTFTDVTEEESEAYIDTLKKEGFREYSSEGNEGSGGLILFRDGMYLSVAYSDGTLGFTAVTE